MNLMTWIDKVSNGLPHGRPSLWRQTRGLLFGDQEVRAPPTLWAKTATEMGRFK